MPPVTNFPERGYSRMGPIDPKIDAILGEMYNNLDNPAYKGNPIHPLNFVDALMRGDDWAFEPELYAGLKTGLSPILFPEDTIPNIAAHTTSEILDDHASGSHSKSAFLHHLTQNPSIFSKLVQDPSFSVILQRAQSILDKIPDSGVEAGPSEPGRGPKLVTRKLKPAKKKVDRQPKRLGPEGTWVNDSDGGEEDQTRTIVQRGSATVTALRRQDTLTD